MATGLLLILMCAFVGWATERDWRRAGWHQDEVDAENFIAELRGDREPIGSQWYYIDDHGWVRVRTIYAPEPDELTALAAANREGWQRQLQAHRKRCV